jgi:hypothetical protein
MLTSSPAKGPDDCPKEQIDCPNTQIVSPFIHGVLNLAAIVGAVADVHTSMWGLSLALESHAAFTL